MATIAIISILVFLIFIIRKVDNRSNFRCDCCDGKFKLTEDFVLDQELIFCKICYDGLSAPYKLEPKNK